MTKQRRHRLIAHLTMHSISCVYSKLHGFVIVCILCSIPMRVCSLLHIAASAANTID